MCRLCFSNVSAKWSNTSNLLKMHHLLEYTIVKRAQSAEATASSSRVSQPIKKGQQTLQQCVDGSKKYSTSSNEHKKLTKAVTFFITKDMLPIYIVDKKGFREMVEATNPRYQLPHKDYFSRVAIPSLYEETREQLCKEMREECIHFSATADLWSSCTSEPYLCLTVHYISSDWILKSHCLQAHFTPEDHTGLHLQDAMNTILRE